MKNIVSSFDERLQPAEELFFRWLVRVAVAALLAGTAWIDDAPPLEVAAFIITLYVAIRVAMQFTVFYSRVPINSPIVKALAALFALALFGLSFLTVVTFAFQLANLTAA